MQNAHRRCTGHAIMHAAFPTIAPNQESLSNCCMEALSHSSKMKNSGRYSPWNFTKNYCTYKCHTLRVYYPLKVLLRRLSQTSFANSQTIFRFRFFSQKNKPTQSATIFLTLWIYRTEDKLQSCILVWRDSKKRCVHWN